MSAPLPSAKSPPSHVAIILDGNGRWARERGLVRAEGHAEGARSVREVVRTCREVGVRWLTLYAFSLANWQRPQAEVEALMRLLIRFSEREAVELKERGIAVQVIGDLDELPTATRRAVEHLVASTRPEGGAEPTMTLSLALSYGGRRDILDAMRALAVRVKAGQLLPEELDERWLRAQMSTRELPDVDLLVRTGGEQRLSDFLLLESAYAELYFTPVLWPDFREHHLLEALDTFARRERRFGLTGDQVQQTRVDA